MGFVGVLVGRPGFVARPSPRAPRPAGRAVDLRGAVATFGPAC